MDAVSLDSRLVICWPQRLAIVHRKTPTFLCVTFVMQHGVLVESVGSHWPCPAYKLWMIHCALTGAVLYRNDILYVTKLSFFTTGYYGGVLGAGHGGIWEGT